MPPYFHAAARAYLLPSPPARMRAIIDDENTLQAVIPDYYRFVQIFFISDAAISCLRH